MQILNLFLATCLTLGVYSAPTCSADDNPGSASQNPTEDTPAANFRPDSDGASNKSNTGHSGPSNNSTMSPASGGTKFQVTVTGYQVCLTQGMVCNLFPDICNSRRLITDQACGITGSPGKDPTAAMSAYLIPSYGKGNCGTCWKLSNPRTLDYHGDGTVPTVAGPLNSPQGDGMVVLINNSCAPGADQEKPGAIGQCTQTNANPKDKLGSASVLDLCSETNAVPMFFGSSKPGLAVADVEQVDCSQWSGTIRKAT